MIASAPILATKLYSEHNMDYVAAVRAKEFMMVWRDTNNMKIEKRY